MFMNKSQKILKELFNIQESDYITLNKGQLKKQLQKGGFLGMVYSNYTDDYYADSINNAGRTNWMPLEIVDSRDNDFGTVQDGKLLISSDYFGDKYVRATVSSDEPEIIGLTLHTFKTLHIKDKKGTSFYSEPDTSSDEKLTPDYLYVLSVFYSKTSTYRKKYLSNVPKLENIIEDLIKKGYLSKGNSITKTGLSYLRSQNRQEISKIINDYALSIGKEYYGFSI